MVALSVIAACRGEEKPKSVVAKPIDAGVDAAPVNDWRATCEIALRNAPSVTRTRRTQAVIDGCRVCGGADWKPILAWNTPPPEGPTRAAIEAVMEACGYCDPNGKQRFLGALDDARGKAVRTPWRLYGEVCKDRVSAVPDTRYSSAPWYALDKIARVAGADEKLAPLLDAIELQLPPVSISGVGIDLPEGKVMQPRVGPVHVTVTPTEIRVGMLPRAKLTKDGIVVDHGGSAYPGELVTLDGLDGAIEKLLGSAKKLSDDDPTIGGNGAVAVFAPSEMPAKHLIPVIAKIAKRRVVLAVDAVGGPVGWDYPAMVPVLLDTTRDPKGTELPIAASVNTLIEKTKDIKRITGKPAIVIDPKSTLVVHLAGAASLASYKNADAASITAK